MAKYQSGGRLGISSISVNAASAALDDKDFLAMYLQKNREAAHYTHKALSSMGIASVATQANFLMFPIDLRRQVCRRHGRKKNLTSRRLQRT